LAVHTLDEAMERLRKNHYHLCRALKEARENPAVLEEWRRAPSGVCRVEEGEAARAGPAGTGDVHARVS
jgi:hypothetical protein